MHQTHVFLLTQIVITIPKNLPRPRSLHSLDNLPAMEKATPKVNMHIRLVLVSVFLMVK